MLHIYKPRVLGHKTQQIQHVTDTQPLSPTALNTPRKDKKRRREEIEQEEEVPAKQQPKKKKKKEDRRARTDQRAESSQYQRADPSEDHPDAYPSPGPAPASTLTAEEISIRLQRLNKRALFCERSLDVHSGAFPEFIDSVIRHYRWEDFFQVHPDATVPIVKEFYAQLVDDHQQELQVRGKTISFAPKFINRFYGLPSYREPEGNAAMYEPTEEQKQEALELLTHPGTQWKISPTGVYTLSAGDLLPDPTIWLYIIKKRIMPTVHDATVSLPRVMLLYSIHKRLRIDLGKIIREELNAGAKKKSGPLYFPGLITVLCDRAGVETYEEDEVETTRLCIDHVLISKLMSNQKHRVNAPQGQRESTSRRPTSPPRQEQPAEPSEGNAERREKIDELQAQVRQLQEENRAFFRYARERDVALSAYLASIHNDTGPILPDFPPAPAVASSPTDSSSSETS